MTTEILLHNNPTRHVSILLSHDGQSLSCTVDASRLPDEAWEELWKNGFTSDVNAEQLRLECRPAKDFRDRLDTTLSALRSALVIMGSNKSDRYPEISFLDYAERLVAEESQKDEKSSRTEKYRVSISRFRQFLQNLGKEELLLTNLNTHIIEAFNTFLLSDGLKKSTCAFYNRILQSIYHRGVKENLTADTCPFATVATQVRKPDTA